MPDTDPARETVPAETWTNEDLAPLTRDEFRAMLKDGHFNVPRLRTKDAMLAVLIGTHFAHRRAWNECDSLRSDLAARTTARDQALAERDALRKELDALRAAQTAPPQPLTTTETQPAPHTPGPWIVEDTGTHLWIGPPRSDGSGKVADIVVSMDIARFTPEARARAIANACLIAAAPDLRASRPAPLGDKAREALRLAKVFHAEAHNKVGDFRDWERIKAKFYAALDSLTDSDLAPDPVWVECVEACMAYDHDIPEWDKPSLIPVGKRVAAAGRAARAKGGA